MVVAHRCEHVFGYALHFSLNQPLAQRIIRGEGVWGGALTGAFSALRYQWYLSMRAAKRRARHTRVKQYGCV